MVGERGKKQQNKPTATAAPEMVLITSYRRAPVFQAALVAELAEHPAASLSFCVLLCFRETRRKK
jgi:hypothetical protein